MVMTYYVVSHICIKRYCRSNLWYCRLARIQMLKEYHDSRNAMLSVLKSHFAWACIGVYKQLYCLCKQIFISTIDLQEGFSLSEAVENGSQWERDGLGSKDLQSVGTPLPLEQKHTVEIRISNFSKHSALTTEPRMQIWHVIAIMKSYCKR